ncbi:MAG: glycosyltransferase family 2 protein [Candidatus Binatia bacterium]
MSATPGLVASDPAAAVIVLHWGSKADTLACLRSVAGSSVPPRALLVVDNGTGALAPAEVAAAAPGAELIALPENLGFTGGNNVAIRRALAAGAEWVVLLNNDAVLDRDCLGELVRVAQSRSRVAAVGAKVLWGKDPSRLWVAWGRLTYGAALVERVGNGVPDGPAFAAVREVDWVPGCAMLLARAALEDIGLLDDRFFAYHEDVDWCTSARARGWHVLFAPAARVVHQGEGSLAPRGPANPVRYLAARNTVLFARKHARPGQWLRLAVTITASLPLELARRWRHGETRVVTLLVRGYLDGLLGRAVPVRALGLQ